MGIETAIILAVASSAMTFAGALQEQQQAGDLAKANKLQRQYDEELQVKEDAASKKRARRRLREARAAYGASGLRLIGSPLDTLTDTAKGVEMDVLNINRAKRARLYGYKREKYQDKVRHHKATMGVVKAGIGLVSAAAKPAVGGAGAPL